MSEYQYYEFVAVDRSLTGQQQSELRARSSRATITASSFVNEYHWGDLKGDPIDWVKRYFDAHVYSANWASCRLILRFPSDALDAKMLRDHASRRVDAFGITHAGEHCLIEWSFNEEAGEYERFWTQEDGPGWMARLLPLRDELLRGDARPLYLGWLARLRNDELDDDDCEPPLPAGLRTLTPAQTSLAEFLMLDPDWLAAAAEASPPLTGERVDRTRLNPWLSELTETEMRDALHRLLDGRGPEVERDLRGRFQQWELARTPKQTTTARDRRTVADLESRYDAFCAIRQQQEKQANDAAEARRKAERERYLASVLHDASTTWSTIDTTLQRGTGGAYSQAFQLLQDLAEAHAQAKRAAAFRRDLAKLMTQHGKRGAWVTRLAKAGVSWESEA
jgi:hypothetical protein